MTINPETMNPMSLNPGIVGGPRPVFGIGDQDEPDLGGRWTMTGGGDFKNA